MIPILITTRAGLYVRLCYAGAVQSDNRIVVVEVRHRGSLCWVSFPCGSLTGSLFLFIHPLSSLIKERMRCFSCSLSSA